MRELHLFAGIGGGIYGGKLLGHTCTAGVEIDKFCQDVLKQRQKDGWLEKFPIYGDIESLSGVEFIDTFDILCGGFPCQAFSTAARGRNLQEKDLWGEMFRFIKESKAPIVFAENVTKKAITIAEKDLNSIGYKATYIMLSNGHLGSNHQRNRFWLLAVKETDKDVFLNLYNQIIKLSVLNGTFWTKEIKECGIVHSSIEKRKQLKAIGNAQSPVVAATAFRILIARLKNVLDGNVVKSHRVLQSEINKVYREKTTWIDQKYGKDFGHVHTPTTMANYSAPSMMKHRGCRNFVEVFSQPNPDNAEWLMGFPINASNPHTQKMKNITHWEKLFICKE